MSCAIDGWLCDQDRTGEPILNMGAYHGGLLLGVWPRDLSQDCALDFSATGVPVPRHEIWDKAAAWNAHGGTGPGLSLVRRSREYFSKGSGSQCADKSAGGACEAFNVKLETLA